MNDVLFAFGLTLLAGMATAIGSVIAFSAKRTNYRFLSLATGFSAGVMLYVSFVEILFKGINSLAEAYGDQSGPLARRGLLLRRDTVDRADRLPGAGGRESPRDAFGGRRAPLHDPSAPKPDRAEAKLLRMGLVTALAIGIHNFPEGLATFLAALQDPSLGVAIAIAIALHNIPEGISVSVPIYYATGSRRKAFIYSGLSGLAEPVGALIAYGAIRLFLGGDTAVVPPQVMGVLFGLVAGIMVYISLDQLLPTSRAYGKGHDTLIGMVAGMLVMALSLLLMR